MEQESEVQDALSLEEVLKKVVDETTDELHRFKVMMEAERRNMLRHDVHHFGGGSRDLGL